MYGGGYYGVGYVNRLLKAGYNVIGILDKEPKNVKNPPVPVSVPELSVNRFGYIDEVFIWICVSNGFLHLEIARKLYSMGYKKILLLPLFLNSKNAKEMICSYNSFCLGNYNADITFYENIWDVYASDYILSENSGYVTVQIPENHLYGLSTDKDTRRSNPFSLHKVTKNNPLKDDEFVPLRHLKENFIEIFDKNRNDLYSDFESALFNNSDVFIQCAGFAQLSKSYKYWYILDGYHRASFLLIKGFQTVPMRVRKEEWNIYFKEDKAQNLMSYLKNYFVLPYKIDHPAFVNLPIKNSESGEEFRKLYSDLFP